SITRNNARALSPALRRGVVSDTCCSATRRSWSSCSIGPNGGRSTTRDETGPDTSMPTVLSADRAGSYTSGRSAKSNSDRSAGPGACETPPMLRFGTIVMGADDVELAVTFWSNVLGYDPVAFPREVDGFTMLVPPSGEGTRVALHRSDVA